MSAYLLNQISILNLVLFAGGEERIHGSRRKGDQGRKPSSGDQTYQGHHELRTGGIQVSLHVLGLGGMDQRTFDAGSRD